MPGGGLPGAVAVDGSAAFVRHAHGGEKGAAAGTRGFGYHVQAGFLKHLPDSGLQQILPRLHQSGRKFVYIGIDGVAVLFNQHHPILLLPVNAIENHAVGTVVVGGGLDGVGLRSARGDIILPGRTVPEPGIQPVKVQIGILCQLLNILDAFHGIPSLISL